MPRCLALDARAVADQGAKFHASRPPCKKFAGGIPPAMGVSIDGQAQGQTHQLRPQTISATGSRAGWLGRRSGVRLRPHVSHLPTLHTRTMLVVAGSAKPTLTGYRLLSIASVGIGVPSMAMGVRRGGQESWQPSRDNAPSRKPVVDSAARLATGCLAVSATVGARGGAHGVLARHNPAGQKRLSGTLP
jgi:hypothetical protein